MKNIIILSFIILAGIIASSAQTRQPSVATRPFIVKSGKELSDINEVLEAKAKKEADGPDKKPVVTAINDIKPQGGIQVRIAVQHDARRESDKIELHDASDDIYYVLDGEATLMLGGKQDNPQEASPGEWKSNTATGQTKVVIKKGDIVFVPRGTPHQRTVTGKGFSMILVKIFAENQPVK
jgi:mannose-6-phosphate isomerase-like protein (cupin superfamily)